MNLQGTTLHCYRSDTKQNGCVQNAMGAGWSNYFVTVSVFNVICLAIKYCYFCFTELAKIHFYVSWSMTCNTGKLYDLTYEPISEYTVNVTDFTLLSVHSKKTY